MNHNITIFFADLALIRLEKTVTFISGIKFIPICLPTKHIRLHGQIAYLERKGTQDKVDCLTDDFGPEKGAKCRYQGNIYAGERSIYYNGSFKSTLDSDVEQKNCQ